MAGTKINSSGVTFPDATVQATKAPTGFRQLYTGNQPFYIWNNPWTYLTYGSVYIFNLLYDSLTTPVASCDLVSESEFVVKVKVADVFLSWYGGSYNNGFTVGPLSEQTDTVTNVSRLYVPCYVTRGMISAFNVGLYTIPQTINITIYGLETSNVTGLTFITYQNIGQPDNS
jgi:hypothetical protein